MAHLSAADILADVGKPTGNFSWLVLAPSPEPLVVVGFGDGVAEEVLRCVHANSEHAALFIVVRISLIAGATLRRPKHVFITFCNQDKQSKHQVAKSTVVKVGQALSHRDAMLTVVRKFCCLDDECEASTCAQLEPLVRGSGIDALGLSVDIGLYSNVQSLQPCALASPDVGVHIVDGIEIGDQPFGEHYGISEHHDTSMVESVVIHGIDFVMEREAEDHRGHLHFGESEKAGVHNSPRAVWNEGCPEGDREATNPVRGQVHLGASENMWVRTISPCFYDETDATEGEDTASLACGRTHFGASEAVSAKYTDDEADAKDRDTTATSVYGNGRCASEEIRVALQSLPKLAGEEQPEQNKTDVAGSASPSHDTIRSNSTAVSLNCFAFCGEVNLTMAIRALGQRLISCCCGSSVRVHDDFGASFSCASLAFIETIGTPVTTIVAAVAAAPLVESAPAAAMVAGVRSTVAIAPLLERSDHVCEPGGTLQSAEIISVERCRYARVSCPVVAGHVDQLASTIEAGVSHEGDKLPALLTSEQRAEVVAEDSSKSHREHRRVGPHERVVW